MSPQKAPGSSLPRDQINHVWIQILWPQIGVFRFSEPVSTSGGIRTGGHVCVMCLALCPAYGSARWQVAGEVRAFQEVDASAHLRCSPGAQNDHPSCGLGGTGSYSCFGPLFRTGTIGIPWAVGGQVGFPFPRCIFLYLAHSWAIWKCNIAVTSSRKTQSLNNLTCHHHPSW